ncbi:SUKH-4 family immunity protein [Streptomyces sp. NPDC005435]|uniref:SUKH-4 family immunity protein n=1 Tax=Streptomyces sp. NPDC005435 TaxID=3154464 RepID=UPI0034551498
MLFTVDHGTLTRAALVDEVSRLPEPTARAYGFHGGTLDFLVRTGLPSADAYDLWFGVPDAFDPGYVWAYAEQAGQGWVHPGGAETVVKLGGFLTNSVAIDPRTGVVYQYTEGTKQVVPLPFAVSPADLVEAFGLGNVVRYARPAPTACRFDGWTGAFLSRVGLPDTGWFMSRADLDHHGSIVLSEWPDRDEEMPEDLRARVTEFDPLPFADDESPWSLTLEEVVHGIW